MTASKDGSTARTTTARNPVSDTAFVVGGLAAVASIVVGVLGIAVEPFWLLAGAIVFLTIGSLTRSMAVRSWERREPAWQASISQVEATLAEATNNIQTLNDAQTAKVDAATAAIQQSQSQLASRFTGMEKWVAKNAVPLVQSPETVLEPAIRKVTRESNQKVTALQEDMKALRRQAEAAVRAFATLPPSDEMAKWPKVFESLETGMTAVHERVQKGDDERARLVEQIAEMRRATAGATEQVSIMRASVDRVAETQETGKERWRLVERQCQAFEDRLADLDLPDRKALEQRLQALRTSILAAMPDMEARYTSLQDELNDKLETRLAAQQSRVDRIATLQAELDAIPAKIELAVAPVRQQLTTPIPQPEAAPAPGKAARAADTPVSEDATPKASKPAAKKATTKAPATKTPAVVRSPQGSGSVHAHKPKAENGHDEVIVNAQKRLKKRQTGGKADRPTPEARDADRIKAARQLVARSRRR